MKIPLWTLETLRVKYEEKKVRINICSSSNVSNKLEIMLEKHH